MNKKEHDRLIQVFKILNGEAEDRADYIEDAAPGWKDWYRGQCIGIRIARDWLTSYFPFLEEMKEHA